MSQPCTWSRMNAASTLFARPEPGQHGKSQWSVRVLELGGRGD
jgi:hypothetical protein